MARYTSALALAKAMEAQLLRKRVSVEKALAGVAAETYRDIGELLSGTTSQRQLNREGNPYGRRFTTPRGKRRGRRAPLPINKQTGRLFNARFMETRRGGGKTLIRVGVKPRQSYFKFVLASTRKMVSRGLLPEIERRFKSRKLGVRNAFRKR